MHWRPCLACMLTTDCVRECRRRVGWLGRMICVSCWIVGADTRPDRRSSYCHSLLQLRLISAAMHAKPGGAVSCLASADLQSAGSPISPETVRTVGCTARYTLPSARDPHARSLAAPRAGRTSGRAQTSSMWVHAQCSDVHDEGSTFLQPVDTRPTSTRIHRSCSTPALLPPALERSFLTPLRSSPSNDLCSCWWNRQLSSPNTSHPQLSRPRLTPSPQNFYRVSTDAFL